jgi:phosphodiesterase/alkaline phosphatase D-like protein
METLTKKVKLKNIVTDVPANATIITDFSQLKPNDKILVIWDNANSWYGTPMEINNRLFAFVKSVNDDELVYTGDPHNHDFFNLAKNLYNATTCTFGVMFNHNISNEVNFPKVIFKL